MKLEQKTYNELLARIERLEVLLNGGKGSGNFGHSGRPGKVGGSGKTIGGPSSKEARHRADRRWAKSNLAHKSLAYLVSAGRAGQHIPLEEIMKEKTIQEAEKKLEFDKNTLEQYKGDKEREKLQNELVNKLLDDKYNGAYLGKDVPGDKRFTGGVDKNKEAFIVIGPPAGGKSSVFANPLSKEHKARIIDSDTVKTWLPEFDNGFGAGRVQEESSMIMEKALSKAIKKGENVVIPKVGGSSIVDMAKELKKNGYKVSLCYNEVSTENSIARAMSRFAEEGRYLSPKYLTSIGDKPKNTFMKYAENKDIFDYAEWRNNNVAYGRKPKTVWKSTSGQKLS